MRMQATKMLEEGGYEVLEAATGSEATTNFESQRPDCVLRDITMPEIDGPTALKKIRQIDPEARIAMGQQSIDMEALQAGSGELSGAGLLRPLSLGEADPDA